jgi:metal-responsive CopG/Arc/MetJ family transcriptional regulator
MRRVHINLNDELLDRIDAEAKKANKSRSAILQEVGSEWVNRGRNEHTEVGSKWAIDSLRKENENLKLRVEDLERSLRWLEGEYSKVNDALVRKALPGGFFSKLKFWGKR